MTKTLKRAAVTAVMLVCGGLPPLESQTATAPALKAAYLYNFAKFTEWPGDSLPAGEPLVLCIISDHAVYDGLVNLTKDRAIGAHPIAVKMIKSTPATLAACRLVFASGLDAAGSAALIDMVAGKPVFTASDLESFAQFGGVAGFYVEAGTLRFAINQDAAQRSGLHLSSRLLTLARIVKDDRSALHR